MGLSLRGRRCGGGGGGGGGVGGVEFRDMNKLKLQMGGASAYT